jgi:hypothetical protein
MNFEKISRVHVSLLISTNLATETKNYTMAFARVYKPTMKLFQSDLHVLRKILQCIV